MSNEPAPERAYYSIGDVCELTGLKPHVLRYWETQFPSLRPVKNRAGVRVYRPKDVELIRQVRHLLYERQYTIAGAKQRLHEAKRTGGVRENEAVSGGEEQALAAEDLLADVRDGLERLRDLLTVPPGEDAG